MPLSPAQRRPPPRSRPTIEKAGPCGRAETTALSLRCDVPEEAALGRRGLKARPWSFRKEGPTLMRPGKKTGLLEAGQVLRRTSNKGPPGRKAHLQLGSCYEIYDPRANTRHAAASCACHFL